MMITEKKPKLSVVEHLQDEHGYRVIKRPADDAKTFFRRLHKQVTNTDTTIPRDDVEKCFRAAGLPPASDPRGDRRGHAQAAIPRRSLLQKYCGVDAGERGHGSPPLCAGS
jgi:hypothetical protein